MRHRRHALLCSGLLTLVLCPWVCGMAASAAKPRAARAPRVHFTVLGGTRMEPYSPEGDPEGAQPGETQLAVRPLLVDGRVHDWTTGEPHDITERSFVVRRALRINDSLPGDPHERWVWQRGPWLWIDRTTGKVTALKLADFSPGISQVSWFRDYAAYCGITSSEKALYAVVAQLTARRPVLAKKLEAWSAATPRTGAACLPPLWQRDPMQVTFQPAGAQPVSFALTAASTTLVEPADEDSAATP